jgi:hypothetical protein
VGPKNFEIVSKVGVAPSSAALLIEQPRRQSHVGVPSASLAPDDVRCHDFLYAPPCRCTVPGPDSVVRVLLMTKPPFVDAGKISDKDYISQRIGMSRRSGLVNRPHVWLQLSKTR